MIAADTNVFVYAIDSDDPARSHKAIALLQQIELGPSVMLWQVACEFGAVMQQPRFRGRVGVDPQRALDAWIELYPLVTPTRHVLDAGWRLLRDHQVSYWDAMLLAACAEAGVRTLYTEDMQSAGTIAGVQIVNPFT